MKLTHFLFSGFIAVFLLGCVYSKDKTLIVSGDISLTEKNNGKALVKKEDPNLPKRVAIIPFEAKTKKISKIITRYFYNSFSSLKYKDIELDTIDRVLKDRNLEDLTYTEIKEIAKLLNVDGIIIGKVTNFDRLYAGVYSSVTVGAELDFYNTKLDKKIWTFEEKAAIREGGFSLSPVGIATQLVLAAYNLRDVQLYRATEDLFRDVFKTIPQPKYSNYENPPIIKFAIDNIKSKPAFKGGDTLLFSIDSEPGLDIFAEIPSEVNLQKFQETKAGHYELKYVVNSHIKEAKGFANFVLKRKNGLEARYTNFSSEIIIDNIPPKTPKIEFFVKNNQIKVVFEDVQAEELQKYVLEGLKNNTYENLGETKNKELSFNLNLGQKIFVKAYSVDLAGNKSQKATPILIANMIDNRIIKAKKLKKEIFEEEIFKISKISGNTQISGIIRVHPNAVLFIEKGANLTFTKNGKIINNGGEINIYAPKDSPVLVKSSSENYIFDLQKGETNIQNLVATTPKAILLSGKSKLNISDSSIKSKFSSIYLKDSSKANITSSYFEASSDMSNITVEGASSVEIQKVTFGKKTTFDMSINSTKKSFYSNPQEKLNILGVINVKK